MTRLAALMLIALALTGCIQIPPQSHLFGATPLEAEIARNWESRFDVSAPAVYVRYVSQADGVCAHITPSDAGCCIDIRDGSVTVTVIEVYDETVKEESHRRGVLLHELGHVVMLEHSDDGVMNSIVPRIEDWLQVDDENKFRKAIGYGTSRNQD